MNNVTVPEMIEEILKIERLSIRKRRNEISSMTKKYGRNKLDADVVNKILAIVENGGFNYED